MATSETRRVSPLREARGNRLQADIAKEAGISVSYVSMIESGLVPPVAVQERLADAVGKSVSHLFGGNA